MRYLAVTLPVAPLLQTHELCIARGGRVLLSGFALELSAGEGVHLLGANGAGKTSLLRVLAGLSVPEAGRLQVATPALYLGHALGLKPELTVSENLSFFAGLAGVEAAEQVLEQALARVGLARYFDAPLHTLSAGQRRRIALARLLIEPARLWLLDEPFAALDVRASAWLCAELDAFMAGGGAVLLTSHQAVATTRPLRSVTVGAPQ